MWGKADRFLTIILVAAIENMSIEGVSMNLKKSIYFDLYDQLCNKYSQKQGIQ